MSIREKNILGAISEFFVRLTTNQYIDGILTFRNDLKIRQTKKIHFVNDSDVTNATVEYDSTVNKVKINKATQVNGADVLTTSDMGSDLNSSSIKPVQNKVIFNELKNKAGRHLYEGNPNLANSGHGLEGRLGDICFDTTNQKIYILTKIDGALNPEYY